LTPWGRWQALAGVLIAATGAVAQAQAPAEEGRRIVRAERLAAGETVTLDGILDEAIWSRAVPATDFLQQDPVPGEKPTERTEVRFAFDEHHLYMGVICYDSEPDKLLGNTKKRDDFLRADDRFMWTMDTFLNEQTGYFFEMNPSGLMADALMGPGGTNNREWDGIWNARVRRSDIGWVIEIDLPFRTLAFDPNAPAWGVNFQRTVRRKNEESLWTGHLRNQGLRRMSNAGWLVGIENVSQGLGLDVKPYVAGTTFAASGAAPPVPRDTDGEVGLDVAYSLTPSLRAVATINTDFAETEVDERQVNLTRFPLKFPEKRAFFLDGATFFDFPETAFFSRQIGLDPEGRPQRINVGGKLTGQAGPFDLGALYVRTAESANAPGEDFLVGRVRRRILRQSYVGGLYTGRSTRSSGLDTRHTLAADFRLATSTFAGNKNLEATGFLLRTTGALQPSAGQRDWFGAGIAYPNDLWDLSLKFQEQQANVAPAVGFLERTAYRRYSPILRYSPRPREHPWVRRLQFAGEFEIYTDLQNRLVTRELNFTLARVETHSQDSLEMNVIPSYERLEEDFEISSGVILPAGAEYHFTRYRVFANTANRRIVAVRPRIEWGRFFSGSRRETALDVTVRPRPGVTLSLSTEWNRLSLQEGSFETWLHRFVLDTQFSPFMYLVNNVQYDSVTRVLGWQSRFRWILKPGNDIFFVYSHNWIDPETGSGFRTLDSRTAAKVSYTKRF